MAFRGFEFAVACRLSVRSFWAADPMGARKSRDRVRSKDAPLELPRHSEATFPALHLRPSP